jgi:hypothetical protein
METPQDFTTRALRIQHKAISLSNEISGSNAEVNRWMSIAKQKGMTWVGGLHFSVEQMRRGREE